MQNTTDTNLLQLAIEKSDEVNSVIENQMLLVKDLAYSPYVREMVAGQYHSGSPKGVPELGDYFGLLFENAGGMYENIFVSAGSQGIADGLGNATIHDQSGELSYEKTMESGSYVGTEVSPVTGLPVLNVTSTVLDPDSEKPIGAMNTS